MSFTLIVVAETFDTPLGVPAAGTVTVNLNEDMSNGATIDTSSTVLPITDGALNQALAATDDPATTTADGKPATYHWIVDLDGGTVREWDAPLPIPPAQLYAVSGTPNPAIWAVSQYIGTGAPLYALLPSVVLPTDGTATAYEGSLTIPLHALVPVVPSDETMDKQALEAVPSGPTGPGDGVDNPDYWWNASDPSSWWW
jgi:hypothetical protein